MEADALEQEMNYPNPVERSDLPVKRRRWPKIVAGAGVLLLLMVVFLPQILSSRVGRKFVVNYISGITNSPVTVESVSTSWFGGTTIRMLTIKDPMGRRIGFRQLHCQASLWKLLTGRYELGDCTIDDLSVEYVIDDGRGRDTLDFMKPPPEPGTPPPPPTSGWNRELPRLNGKIRVNGGTLTLWRGTVQPKLFDVTWERARFTDLKADLDIPQSLDQPWKYSLSAIGIEDGRDEKGAISSSGTVDLGAGGKFDAGEMALDLKIEGADLRSGPLGAVMIPTATGREVRETLGDSIQKLSAVIKAVDGDLTIENLDVRGAVARMLARATFDIASTPATLVIAPAAQSTSTPAASPAPSAQPVTITLGVSKRVAANFFVYFNPFLRDAAGGPNSGTVTLTLDSLKMPLGASSWRTLSAGGHFKAQGVTIARVDEMHDNDERPDNLASQLALLTGDSMQAVPLNADQRFTIADGEVKLEPAPTRLGSMNLVLAGITDLDTGGIDGTVRVAPGSSPGPGAGAAAASLVSSLAQANATFAIKGTVGRPQLMLGSPGNLPDAIVKALSDQVSDHVNKLRAKEAQRQMQKSQQDIDNMLKPLKGMDQRRRTATQNATQPATTPK
jgi:hypothetical protein